MLSKKRKIETLLTDTFTVLVSSQNLYFYEINEYICKKYIEQNNNNDIILRLSDIKNKDIKSVSYQIPYDKVININYNNNIITCKLYKVSGYHGTSFGVSYLSELSLTSIDKSIIENFFRNAIKNKDTLMIYHYNSRENYWKKFGKIQERDEKTLIIDKSIKNKIITDISEFIDSKDIYIKYGIPYKRNYLFYGKPGTGKTSLAKILANKTKRSIYIISFDMELTDNSLYTAINSIKDEKSILLLEDIDCIFQNRTTNLSNSLISFSCLLNILDGVTSSNSLITIITTNYIDKLDSALTRPGRIDMMIKFTTISKEQIIGLIKLYERCFSSKIVNYISKICKNKQLTASTLSGFLFRYRNTELNDTNVIDMFNTYLEEIIVKKDNTNNSLYM